MQRILGTLLICAMVLTGFAPGGASAAERATVRFDPATTDLRVGTEFALAVTVEGVENLAGYSFELEFNPAVLRLVDAYPNSDGVNLGHGSVFAGKSPLVEPNAGDNSRGTAVYNALVLTANKAFSGSGTLAVAQFRVVGAGSTPVRFKSGSLVATNGLVLGDVNAAAIPYTVHSLILTVGGDGSTVGQGPTTEGTGTEGAPAAANPQAQTPAPDASAGTVEQPDPAGQPATAEQPGSTGEPAATGAADGAAPAGTLTYPVDANGSNIRALDGALTLTIPAGALDRDTDLTVARPPGTPVTRVPGLTPVGGAVDVTVPVAAGAVARPVTLRLAYPSTVDADTARYLGLYRLVEQQPHTWHYVGGRVDTDARTVTAAVERFGRFAVMAYQPSFSDLAGHWATDPVTLLGSRHVLSGDPGGTFRPDDPVTRAEMAKLLVEALGRDPDRQLPTGSGSSRFADVDAAAWYAGYVETAARLGLVQGAGGRYRPADPITREELTTMMVRALGLEAEAQSYTADSLARRLTFTDSGQLPAWSRPYVAAAAAHGVVRGIGGGRFGAGATATRAEAATLIYRLMERLQLL